MYWKKVNSKAVLNSEKSLNFVFFLSFLNRSREAVPGVQAGEPKEVLAIAEADPPLLLRRLEGPRG